MWVAEWHEAAAAALWRAVCRDDTCVFVSQSGETADTLRALEYAKVSGVRQAFSTAQRVGGPVAFAGRSWHVDATGLQAKK